jgi:hypothetical protein
MTETSLRRVRQVLWNRKVYLYLPSAFANQVWRPTSQMADHQEPLEARRGSAPGFAQALVGLRIFAIPSSQSSANLP